VSQRRRVMVVDGAKRLPVDLETSDFMASGATGDVYRLRGQTQGKWCIKLHKSPDAQQASKLQAMMQRPPSGVQQRLGTQEYVRFAWPSKLVEDTRGQVIGFVMPEMDFSRTRSMVTYTERREMQRFLTPDQRSLPRRVAVCANLCALMSDLHSQGHAFVDFKDQNVRVYPENDLVGFIDTDGFRIQANVNRYFPGQHTTPTFNSPESVKGSKTSLGEFHDRFVLAILLFRVLNRGIHPFQGIPNGVLMSQSGAFDLDKLIEQQAYPYGAHGCQNLDPTKGSWHTHWDSRTLAMFERTFTTRDSSQRVGSMDWLTHFRELQKTGFVRCPQHPKDIEHVHFKGNRCPICAASASQGQGKPTLVPVPTRPTPPTISAPSQPTGLPAPQTTWSLGAKVFLGAAVAAGVWFVLMLL